MSSDLIKHITDASFEADVCNLPSPCWWTIGPNGAVLLQNDRPHPRRSGQGLQRPPNVAKMNVDQNRDVPAKFGIRGIPTLMIFKGGQLAATKVGAPSKAQLTAFIDGNL